MRLREAPRASPSVVRGVTPPAPFPLFSRPTQELIVFLQHLPTEAWAEKEVEMVLARAYLWRASGPVQ